MSFFGSIGHFIKSAARTAGRAVHSAGHAVSFATGAVSSAISKIPVVGAPFHSIYDLTLGAPLALTGDIASGANIGKAAFKRLKAGVQDIREVGPYAQMILAEVPGPGTAIASGLAMGLAMANGRPIDKAVLEAVKAGIPGGAAAKTIFSVTESAVSGKGLNEAALQALPIPDEAKQYVGRAIDLSKNIAEGKRVDKLLVAQVDKEIHQRLPPTVAQAITTATAVATAKNLQQAAARGAQGAMGELSAAGANIVRQNPVLQKIRKEVPADPFNTAIGLMRHSGVPETAIWAIRNQYKGAERKAFDLGLAAHIGAVTSPARKLPPDQLAGYYLAHGLRSTSPKAKVALLQTVAKDPAILHGVKLGAKAVKTEHGIWFRIKEWLGLAA